MKALHENKIRELRDYRQALALSACGALCDLAFETRLPALRRGDTANAPEVRDDLNAVTGAILEDFMLCEARRHGIGQSIVPAPVPPPLPPGFAPRLRAA